MGKFEQLDLELCYLKAKAAFKKCIENIENKFLIDELGVPINSLLLTEESVKVNFSKREIDEYVIEIKINILSKDEKVLGVYILYEDDEGILIDDSLIIH